MDLTADLLAAADDYCARRGISKPRLATIVANDGKFFDRVEKGGGITIKMYERFLAYFRDNPVPADTDRPCDTEQDSAA